MNKEEELNIDRKVEAHRESCTRNYVAWPIFIWVMGFIVVVFGWFFYSQAALATKVSAYQDTNSKIESRLTGIETNIDWIKNNINK